MLNMNVMHIMHHGPLIQGDQNHNPVIGWQDVNDKMKQKLRFM